MTLKRPLGYLVALGIVLLACKKKEQPALPDASVPVPEPPKTEAPATASAPPAESEKEEPASSPKTKTTTSKKDGGTKTDAGTKTTGSKQCFDKCQAALQACLTPPKKDGGYPSLGKPAECQAAFSACQAACK